MTVVLCLFKKRQSLFNLYRLLINKYMCHHKNSNKYLTRRRVCNFSNFNESQRYSVLWWMKNVADTALSTWFWICYYWMQKHILHFCIHKNQTVNDAKLIFRQNTNRKIYSWTNHFWFIIILASDQRTMWMYLTCSEQINQSKEIVCFSL